MPQQLAPVATSTPADTAKLIATYAAAEKAPSTRRAYRADWEVFSSWCRLLHDVEPLGVPPDTVAAFLAGHAAVGVNPSTSTRRLAAIGYAHELAGLQSPMMHDAVRAVLRGIRRTVGSRPIQKAPATAERLAMMVEAIPADTLRGARDRALLLFGFAGAFRRSELVMLDVADLTFDPREYALPFGGQRRIRRAGDRK